MNIKLPVKTHETLPASGGRRVDFSHNPELQVDRGGPPSGLSRYISAALKHKYFITGVIALFLSGGAIVTQQIPKIYSASTTVKIDRSDPQIYKSETAQTNLLSDDTQFYATQYELIRSRALAERVATTLDLAHSNFLSNPQPSLLQRLSPALTEHVSTALVWGEPRFLRNPQQTILQWLFGAETTRTTPISDDDALEARQAMAVSRVMGGLSVQPVRQSSIVRITYSALDPSWAQRISIAVAEQFEKMTLDMLVSAPRHAETVLQKRLDELRLKLEESEKELIQYAQKEGIVDVDNKQPQVLADLQAVQGAYSNAVTARLLLEETWRQAQANDENSLPQVMADNLILNARTKLAQLIATYQNNLTVLAPASPKMLALQKEISETKEDIRTQIGRIRKSIDDQYQAAVANEKALSDKRDQLKADALDLRRRSVDYMILMDDVDRNRSLYEGVLRQYRESGVASDAQSNNVSILDRALLPGEPTWPSLRLNLMLALALGAAAAAAGVWLIEGRDDTFKSAEDLEARLGLPVLGAIPLSAKKKSAVSELLDEPSSPLVEAYRSLRTAIQFAASDGAPRSILITSSRPGEGKSTIALSLAANFSQLGMRVLLIDADFRNPSQHRMMNLENTVGLSNYLLGGHSSVESQYVGSVLGTLKQTSIPNLAVMTSGAPPPSPVELLAGPRLGVLLNEAAGSFDIVIIDSPAIMDYADVPILSTVVDGTVLVVEGAKTRPKLVQDALKRLRFVRARVLGGILNKYHAKRSGDSFYEYGRGNRGGANYVYGQSANRAIGQTMT